jgi:chromosome segregation ATPase
VSRKRGIQYDVVAAIAASLLDQGFTPDEISAGAIREETGTGSLTTIVTHLKRWREQTRPAVARVALSADKLEPITTAVTALVNECSELIREEGRKANAGTVIEAEKIRAERDDAYTLNEQIESEREAAAAEARDLRAEVEAGRLREANLQGQLDALGGALARLERAAVGLSSEDAGKGGHEVELATDVGNAGVTRSQANVTAAAVADTPSEPQLFGGPAAQEDDSLA